MAGVPIPKLHGGEDSWVMEILFVIPSYKSVGEQKLEKRSLFIVALAKFCLFPTLL